MIANFEEIELFAESRFLLAQEASESIAFSLNEKRSRYAKTLESAEASYHIGNEPKFAILTTSKGVGGWAVVLSVDLRGSSKRAVEIGAEDTYLTMHTYLPTMGELVRRADGRIAGLRGDGLIALFGFHEYEKGKPKVVTPYEGEQAIRGATKCGHAMIEATKDILNPLLERHNVLGKLQIGVGICVGEIVLTNIGIADATERTIYGPPVNHACKASGIGKNEMVLTNNAESIYPSSKGGRINFKPVNLSRTLGGQYFIPHRDFIMLPRKRPSQPR